MAFRPARRGDVASKCLLVSGVALLMVGGCRGIAGLRDLGYAPDAGCVSPSLPTSGNGQVRVANLSTEPGETDFCIRTSGAAGWGSPVFATGGPSCQLGLAYAQVTIPFATTAGTIDVKAIPAGASCDATGTSEADGIHVGSAGASVVSLVRFGGGSIAERIVALPEEPGGTPEGVNEHLRIVNALSGGSAINIGVASSPSLPATLAAGQLASPIQPGQAAAGASAFWRFDSFGYSNSPDTGFPVGVAPAGQSNALFVASTATGADQQTLFSIGDTAATDALHRVKGLMCEDRALPSSSSPMLARCSLTALPSLGVDTVNVSLYGNNGPFESERRPYIYAAIAARTTDLTCLVETSRDSDKAGIAQAAKARFPYSYYVQTTLATQPTDPETVDGGTPPAPSSPPCAGVDPTAVTSPLQCVAQQCTNTGTESGVIATTNCLSAGACGAKFLELYRTGSAQDACFDCLLYDLTSGTTVSQAQQECTQRTAQPFAFEGMTSSMILSHYPLSHQQAYILPGTGFRHAVLYAQVELEDQSVDFYCAQLISPFIDTSLPYTGNYGQDGTVTLADGGHAMENGWQDEQDLQVRRAIEFIQKTSGGSKLPAIIAGDWHTSPRVAQPDAGVPAESLSPEVLAALEGAFLSEEPMGYVDTCNDCPAPLNPYNGNETPADFSHTFLLGFPGGSIVQDQYWDTSNGAVPITGIQYEPAPASGTGPLWEYYPRLVYVVRPPTQ
jgi:hypothetical protein